MNIYSLKIVPWGLVVVLWTLSYAGIIEAQCRTAQLSENRRYRLGVTGGCHDCYGGEWEYSLYVTPSTQLWNKTLIWGGMPVISTRGETAIPQQDAYIMFYDRTGEHIGQFSGTSSGLQLFRSDMFYCLSPVHVYSSDGTQYYLALQSALEQSAIIVSLDHAGHERWRQYLESPHKTCAIHVFQQTLLIDDFGPAISGYVDNAYLLDKASGRILQRYPFNMTLKTI
jgi:hypothetical protein